VTPLKQSICLSDWLPSTTKKWFNKNKVKVVAMPAGHTCGLLKMIFDVMHFVLLMIPLVEKLHCLQCDRRRASSQFFVQSRILSLFAL
jgi:hypothetical protein